jgi:hypothetical protein
MVQSVFAHEKYIHSAQIFEVAFTLLSDKNTVSGERENRRCSGRKAEASHSLAAQEGNLKE